MKGVTFVPISGGVKAFGTDPDVSMDDLADAMFEGFLRSEAQLREGGQSHFDMPEETTKAVAELKRLFAVIVEISNLIASDEGERGRLAVEAIRQAQTALMWAVRAQTYRRENAIGRRKPLLQSPPAGEDPGKAG